MTRAAIALLAPAAALCPGCAALDFNNDRPRIEAVNGVEVQRLFGWSTLQPAAGERDAFVFEPGGSLPFTVEVRDPEGDDVALWWPYAPPGFDFAADAREGTWSVPADFAETSWTFDLLAVDDARDPASATLSFSCWLRGTDTGWDSSGP